MILNLPYNIELYIKKDNITQISETGEGICVFSIDETSSSEDDNSVIIDKPQKQTDGTYITEMVITNDRNSIEKIVLFPQRINESCLNFFHTTVELSDKIPRSRFIVTYTEGNKVATEINMPIGNKDNLERLSLNICPPNSSQAYSQTKIDNNLYIETTTQNSKMDCGIKATLTYTNSELDSDIYITPITPLSPVRSDCMIDVLTGYCTVS